MFTGIVEAQGRLRQVRQLGGDAVLRVDAGELCLDDVALGDSIAVNGVCLTVTALAPGQFEADVSRESLQHTCLGELPAGSTLNLEKALTPRTRLGGHIVTGHVDGIGTVSTRQTVGRAECFTVEAPQALSRYIACKGSITVDGVSLTVNRVERNSFDIMVIPHTRQRTLIGQYKPGRRVHLEVDIIARYLERMLQADSAVETGGLTFETLARHGFAG